MSMCMWIFKESVNNPPPPTMLTSIIQYSVIIFVKTKEITKNTQHVGGVEIIIQLIKKNWKIRHKANRKKKINTITTTKTILRWVRKKNRMRITSHSVVKGASK